jgi:hypothetical protein
MVAKAELCVVVQSHRAYFPDGLGLGPVPVAAARVTAACMASANC